MLADMKESIAKNQGVQYGESYDPRVGFKIFDRLRKIDKELVTEAMKYDVQEIVAMLPGHWTYRGKLREAHRRLRHLEAERMRTSLNITASEFWSDAYQEPKTDEYGVEI